MPMARSDADGREPEQALAAALPLENQTEQASAWELLDTGRYRPRRIRGSFRGRELG